MHDDRLDKRDSPGSNALEKRIPTSENYALEVYSSTWKSAAVTKMRHPESMFDEWK
jgi:hypothetical protein